MRRPRVCLVRQTDWFEFPVRREAEALQRAGFDVEVLLMAGSARRREERVNGVRVTYLPATIRRSSKVGYVVGYASFFIQAAATLAVRNVRRRYAAVQVNTMPDVLVFAAIVPKLLGSRVIAYMHEPSPELATTIYGPGMIARLLAVAEQLVLRFSDHAVAVTQEMKDRFVERGARADKISVVLNGVAPADRIGDWSPPPAAPGSGDFTVICHGLIDDRYGQDTLVEAALLLKDVVPELAVVIAGRGTKADALAAQIRNTGVADVVRFVGWVSEHELNDLLYTADVGVVAQKASPYSHLVHTNKMVDYWIFGLPVIASRLRAVANLHDDDTVEYFEAGDPRDLARAIRRLRDDAVRRAMLARNGRRAHEEFGWPSQEPEFLAVYQRLLGALPVPPCDSPP